MHLNIHLTPKFNTLPLLCPGNLFASAAPHPVSWDETRYPQAQGEELGPPLSVLTNKSVHYISYVYTVCNDFPSSHFFYVMKITN